MLKNPVDLRARRTETQLQTTLLCLLERKPLHQITVAELCRLCPCNRATFYDHYQDIYSLVDALEDGVVEHLQELMDQIRTGSPDSGAVSALFFQFLQEYKRPLRLLLRGETSPDFLQKLDHAIFPFFETMVRQNYLVPPEYSADQLQAILRFLTSGYYGFFLQELEPDSTLRPELPQLAASISDQCLSGFFARSPAHTPLA